MRVNIHTCPLGEPDFAASRKDINWNDSSDRKWLTNHMHWAMNNHQVVTLTPISNRR